MSETDHTSWWREAIEELKSKAEHWSAQRPNSAEKILEHARRFEALEIPTNRVEVQKRQSLAVSLARFWEDDIWHGDPFSIADSTPREE